MPSLNHSPFAIQKPLAGAGIDWGHPLAQGLVLSWDGLEGGGRLAFDSSYGNNGTVTGTAGGIPAAQFGTAWKFDGTTTYIISQSKPVEFGRGGTKAFTHEVWFQNSTKPGANNYYCLTMVGQGYNSGTYDKSLCINNSGFLNSFVYTGSPTFVVGNTDTTDGQWHHGVMTYDGVTLSVFVDGTRQNGGAAGSTFGESPAFFILADKESISIGLTRLAYPGAIASARAWTRALSRDEIKQLFNEPYAMLRGGAASSASLGPRYWDEGVTSSGIATIQNAELKRSRYSADMPPNFLQRGAR